MNQALQVFVAVGLAVAQPGTAVAQPPVAAPSGTDNPPTAPAPTAPAPTAPGTHAPHEVDIDITVSTAKPAAPPPPPTPAEAARKKFRSQRRAMTIAGLSTVGTVYLMTSMQGAFAIDKAHKPGTDPATGLDRKPDSEAITGAKWLMVPVVGPFAAAHYMPTATGRWLSVFSGMIQASTLVIAAVGIVGLRRTRPVRRPQVLGGVAQAGAFLGIRGRF